jgi:hypothetical protein
MGAQMGLKGPPQRHNNRHNNRLLRVPRRPRRPRAQARAQAMTPARVAGPASPNSAIEVQLQCKRYLRIARIAQSVTPMTVTYLTASAQSRVATLHLIVHELLAVLVVSVEIAMPAPHARGGAECREPDVRVGWGHQTPQAGLK